MVRFRPFQSRNTDTLDLLLDKLETYQVDLSELEFKAEILSNFATMYRYPNSDAVPLTEAVVNQAILDAELFIMKAKELLKESKNNGDGSGGEASSGTAFKLQYIE